MYIVRKYTEKNTWQHKKGCFLKSGNIFYKYFEITLL